LTSRDNAFASFPEKKNTTKDLFRDTKKLVLHPKLGEADPGGLGACPQENSAPDKELIYKNMSRLLVDNISKSGLGGTKEYRVV
jgi:hypothetical protein